MSVEPGMQCRVRQGNASFKGLVLAVEADRVEVSISLDGRAHVGWLPVDQIASAWTSN